MTHEIDDGLLIFNTTTHRAISWHVHPPTPLSVVKLSMYLIPEQGCHQNDLVEIEELARFLTELSVCDYFFTQQSAIVTGLAALLTAIDIIGASWQPGAFEKFLVEVESIAKCDIYSKNVLECKSRLQDTYVQGGFYEQRSSSKVRIDGGTSPICVSNVPSAT